MALLAMPLLTMDTLGQPFNVEWIPNRMYRWNRKLAILMTSVFFAIGLLSAGMWAGGIFAGPEGIPPVISALAIVFLGMGTGFLFLGPTITNPIPTHVAVTSKGLYLKYNKPGRHSDLHSAAWTEISDLPNAKAIIGNTETKSSYLPIKVGDTIHYVGLDRELSMRIIDVWRRHQPPEEMNKELAEKKHGEEMDARRKEAEEKGLVDWAVNGRLAAGKSRYRLLMSSMATLFCIPIVIVLVLSILSRFDPFMIFIIIMVEIPVSMFALLFYLLENLTDSRNRISEVGFSDLGLHFRFAHKDPKDGPADFVAWSDIREMAPVVNLNLAVQAGEARKELVWADIDKSRVLRAVRELDNRRNCTCPAPVTKIIETVPNRVYEKLRNRFYKPVFIMACGILAMSVLTYLVPLIWIVGIIWLIVLAFLVFLFFVRPTSARLNYTPRTVSFSRTGVAFSFGKRPVPAGSTDFLSWDALERISSLEDEKQELWWIEGRPDEPGMRFLFAVKKSGTIWLIGLVDPALMDRIRSEFSRWP